MEKSGINGNLLKIIALISMTVDHVGYMLFNDNIYLRCIGRLAFPLFGFMIAEGCFYTHDKLKYFLRIFILGLLCQAVYFIEDRSLYMGILITFSFSIITVFAYEYGYLLFVAVLCFDVLVCVVFPVIFGESGFFVDYGIFGVLFPLFAYIGRKKKYGIAITTAGLALLCAYMGGIQWFAMASLILIEFYSGEKGKLNLKYLFYIYYPAHLVIIYLISTKIP